MIRKGGWLLAGLAVSGGGWLCWPTNSHELEPERIAIRSESFGNGALRWSFDADDAEGNPLETVFYTLEYTPNRAENEVEVVVRLYDAPAKERNVLQRSAGRGGTRPDFCLECPYPEVAQELQPGHSYRISFGGRNLGTWRTDAAPAMVAFSAQ